MPTPETERSIVLVTYVLHLVGAIAGVTSIIGLVLNYVRRSEADALLVSHHSWMIRSFWWALLGVCIGVVTTFILIGWLILGIAWPWYVVRHVRGLIALVNDEPMPA